MAIHELLSPHCSGAENILSPKEQRTGGFFIIIITKPSHF